MHGARWFMWRTNSPRFAVLTACGCPHGSCTDCPARLDAASCLSSMATSCRTPRDPSDHRLQQHVTFLLKTHRRTSARFKSHHCLCRVCQLLQLGNLNFLIVAGAVRFRVVPLFFERWHVATTTICVSLLLPTFPLTLFPSRTLSRGQLLNFWSPLPEHLSRWAPSLQRAWHHHETKS